MSALFPSLRRDLVSGFIKRTHHDNSVFIYQYCAVVAPSEVHPSRPREDAGLACLGDIVTPSMQHHLLSVVPKGKHRIDSVVAALDDRPGLGDKVDEICKRLLELGDQERRDGKDMKISRDLLCRPLTLDVPFLSSASSVKCDPQNSSSLLSTAA